MRFETLCEKVLFVFGLIKVALIAAFFAGSTLIDTDSANAQTEAVCNGQDLLLKLKNEDSAAYARILAEAEKTLNSNSVFWKIEKSGEPQSWLFGTMHMADPAISTIREDVKSAVRNSENLVIESTDALDPQAAQKAIGELAHLTLLTEGTLRDLVEDDLEDELEAAVAARGLPMMLADRMQPWLIATTVALPVCELQRKQAGGKVLDQALAEFAKQEGKNVQGLETVGEQLTAMASLPQEYHVSALEETLASGNGAVDMIETLKATYLDGNMGVVFPLMKEVMPKTGSGKGAADFQEVLIEKRNSTMLERMLPILKSGSSVVAVGALHLPGDKGLVKLLRDEGYTVTSVN